MMIFVAYLLYIFIEYPIINILTILKNDQDQTEKSTYVYRIKTNDNNCAIKDL